VHVPISLTKEDSVREGFGAEINIFEGKMVKLGDDLTQSDFSRAPTKQEVALDGERREHAHFLFNSALLKSMGRADIRRFCAVWLPWLSSKDSTLAIYGHADTVGTPERNRHLSDMRARNTRQAIVDILGPDLAIPPDAIAIHALGEEEGLAEGDETKNWRYRRVDVVLDGRLVLVLMVM
jgi:outer membrane protein OmpA-like peptidoglycan-associated protein